MADIPFLQAFAVANAFNLTNPLSNSQVVELAEYWLPEIRFFEKERFHPISLDEVIDMVEDLYGQLPTDAQSTWQVSKSVRAANGISAEIKSFDPPVVYVPDGAAQGAGGSTPVVRVLNEGQSTRAAMADADVTNSARISHGASVTRADQFFGANSTILGGSVASPGDPFAPRATTAGGNDRQITVMAEYKNLLETLKYNLLAKGDSNYPPDVLREGFDISGLLIRAYPNTTPMNEESRRELLIALIEEYESTSSISGASGDFPPGWYLDKRAWDALTRYAFLEFHFFYAYNDYERTQTAMFDNEHEGDNEGCCLVFDRNVINLAAGDTQSGAMKNAVPHCLITSVHEEWQNADKFMFIPPPIPSDVNSLPRDDMDLIVYSAWGSHATYLSPGDHDLVDFGETLAGISEKAPYLWVIPPLPIAIAILVSIIDHFVDQEDFTSDDGVRTGPDDIVSGEPNAVASRLTVLPMSGDEHIYELQHEQLLALRSFPGKWGGHAGIVDKSPNFPPKTGRYFRKLLKSL